jgi:DNA-binding LacI/PurR family transcriptional regulator
VAERPWGFDSPLSHSADPPDDVSVVGFDDIQRAASHNPLTTIRQPLRQMGEVAAETLVARIVAGARARYVRTILVEPELVVRGSTGPCKS